MKEFGEIKKGDQEIDENTKYVLVEKIGTKYESIEWGFFGYENVELKFGQFGMVQYKNDKGEWLWEIDDTPISIKKPCPKCHLLPLKNGEDPCLGVLPRVQAAYCGHGIQSGYIWFENGKRVRLDKEGIIDELV